MTTIDPRRQLAAVLQSQVDALRQRAGPRATGAGRAPTTAQGAALAQGLRAIDAQDPDRRRKAVRLYLASEFARAFGDTVLNDPAFPRMVDAVQAQMAGDAQLASAVDALGDWLLAGDT